MFNAREKFRKTFYIETPKDLMVPEIIKNLLQHSSGRPRLESDCETQSTTSLSKQKTGHKQLCPLRDNIKSMENSNRTRIEAQFAINTLLQRVTSSQTHTPLSGGFK